MNESLAPTYQNLVAFFGGQTRAANALEVTQPSVNAWVKGGANMSALVAMRAEKRTAGKFKAEQLCPAIKQATA